MRRELRRPLTLAILSIGLSGCYTQMRSPAGSIDGSADPYWYDTYYGDVGYYGAPWEVYPGRPWWFADYCHPPHPYPYSNPDQETYEAAAGRHGWDRGPGEPYIPRTGGIGGGVTGVVTPTTPATPTEASDDSPPDKPRDTDSAPGKDTPSGKRSTNSENTTTKRNGWGR